ncbi:GM17917 [Drosophila sechellia]|uniref:GM17917 n=1 Tax=Drosophila sechellia TaxID=7238 RepID=B4I206_DROSE|nr:GM17917 [Drosophila sechellia]
MSAVPVAIKTEEVILEHAEYNSAEELDEELQLQLEDSGGENYHIEYASESAHQGSQRRQSSMSGTNTSKGGGGGGSGALSDGDGSGKPLVDSEKRMRREIANSNERRRMQSINAGFQSLRSLLPRHEGEKLSKAAILQQTFQYIVELENQKTQPLTQNSELKRQVASTSGGNSTAVAIVKRKLTDNVINIQAISDSSDEGLGSMSPEPMTLLTAGGAAATKLSNATLLAAKELHESKKQLEKERSLRRLLEDELQMIKRQLYSVATAPPGTAVAAASGGSSGAYIPREVIEHTDNFVRSEDLEELGGTVSYVEIDEMTGQQQVVVCSSIEELEADAAAEIITEDQVHEEVILSSNSSTESENEVNVNAIAKAYAEGCTSSAAMLQPILQAAIKATPKVEVERIHEKIVKVKTEKHDLPSMQTATHYQHPHRQNLETIVQAIRHLEGDHLFADGSGGQEKFGQQQNLQQHHHQISGVHHQQLQHHRLAQDAPLALTTTGKQHAALAELRPFLQLKSGGNKQVIITAKTAKDAGGLVSTSSSSTTVTPTAIFKVQTTGGHGSGSHLPAGTSTGTIITGSNGSGGAQQLTITTSLKQCRPGVIVAKQLPSS